jgi:hypothetical protein
MSGRFPRILGRRAAESGPATPAPTSPEEAVPAGTTPSPQPALRDRSRMRRRLRYLRRARELQLRDLGGLVFDLHRFGGSADADANTRHRELVSAKVDELQGTDRELRALEAALDDRRPVQELRLAGIGGLCPRCGALHGSDARFCSACGAPLTAEAPTAPASDDAVAPATETAPDTAPDAGALSASARDGDR